MTLATNPSKMLIPTCDAVLTSCSPNVKMMSCPTWTALLNAAEAIDMTVVLFSELWVKLASTRPDSGGNDPGTAGFLSVNFVFNTM